MLPAVAKHLGLPGNHKEGWLSGLVSALLECGNQEADGHLELAVAFPVTGESTVFGEKIAVTGGHIRAYGFYEDMDHPEEYGEEKQKQLTDALLRIANDFEPDVIHCFGTEYPHTCAICEGYDKKERLLISIQGLCGVYAESFFANLPDSVKNRVTFRDWLKKDSIIRQQQKFVDRGRWEIRAVQAAGNVSGRTHWDKHYTNLWNPKAKYYAMNETLRPCFYEGIWEEAKAKPHSIFLSQGDYPIKGLHYMLKALPLIRKEYPDATVAVSGNQVNRTDGWKNRLKLPSYGKYLNQLIKENHLEEAVFFLGRLNEEQMKEQYLKSFTYVCCSTIENSPNSLGEAMLLGMPCVAADVGGISSIFTDGADGILTAGYGSGSEDDIAASLAKGVIALWKDADLRKQCCEHARAHAAKTHNRQTNQKRMMEIYLDMIGGC